MCVFVFVCVCVCVCVFVLTLSVNHAFVCSIIVDYSLFVCCIFFIPLKFLMFHCIGSKMLTSICNMLHKWSVYLILNSITSSHQKKYTAYLEHAMALVV